MINYNMLRETIFAMLDLQADIAKENDKLKKYKDSNYTVKYRRKVD